jgi:hypothetical protein
MFTEDWGRSFENEIFITDGLHGRVLYNIMPIHTFTNGGTSIIGAVFKIGDDISGTHLYVTTGNTNPDSEVFDYYYLPDDSILNRDNYKEYIFINGAYHKIGDPSVDLKNYVTRDNLAVELDKITGDIDAALDTILAIQKELIGALTITFFINGMECTAKEGMTWLAWMNSEYNTIGAYSSDDGIIYIGLQEVCYLDNSRVGINEQISANESYILFA